MPERPILLVSKRLQLPNKDTLGNEGGLVEALKNMKGRRLGWDGTTTDGPINLKRSVINGIEYNTFPLTEELASAFNRVTGIDQWGEAHGVSIGEPSTPEQFVLTAQVHALYANFMSQIMAPVDVARIDDFQLEGVATAARRRGIVNPIGYQRHIPVPYLDAISAPTSRLMRNLMDADLICLQVPEDISNLIRIAEKQWGARQAGENHLQLGHHRVRLAAIPATIRYDSIAGRDYSPETRSKQVSDMLDRVDGRDLILGLDRMDPAKGLLNKFRGFERLLDRQPHRIDRTVLVQIAPDSRTDQPEYVAYGRQVKEEAARINAKFGREVIMVEPALPGDHKHHPLREAKVTLLTPLRDGMNLVAKEHVAAQDPENPHVLVLSKFAGSAVELKSALLVNPHNVEDIARQIEKGLDMPLAERSARWQAQRDAVLAFQPVDYQGKFDRNMAIVAENMLAQSTNSSRSAKDSLRVANATPVRSIGQYSHR